MEIKQSDITKIFASVCVLCCSIVYHLNVSFHARLKVTFSELLHEVLLAYAVYQVSFIIVKLTYNFTVNPTIEKAYLHYWTEFYFSN